MVQQIQKRYELAYILDSSISEEDVLTHVGKFTTLIENAGGVLNRSENPRRRQLAYPVRKQKTAYFGWITFSANPISLASLEKKLKTYEGLLRHCMVEEQEIKTPPRPLRQFSAHPPASPTPTPQNVLREPPPEEKLDLEALDKKLEEILGK